MKKWTMLSANLFLGTACFAGNMQSEMMHEGFFAGLGASYNSINLTQNSWGEGLSNIQTNTGANSNGVAQGSGAPFHTDPSNTFAPDIQVGYFKHIPCYENYLYGVKFSWQYLGTTTTDSNLYIPQLGETTSAITGVTSSLFGNVNADSVQVSINHEFTFLAFIGRSFGNKYFYFGVGPALFNLQSKNYYSIGYAEFEGVDIDVTGLVSYSGPSVWMWGGAAQLGMTYFVTPTWFIDASYTYALTGSRTTNHQQAFANTSAVGDVTYTTSGTLITKDTLRVNNQSVALTINKTFDF